MTPSYLSSLLQVRPSRYYLLSMGSWLSEPFLRIRFILGDCRSTVWVPLLGAENATYGDIWALEDYGIENARATNDFENMEVSKYIGRDEGVRVRRYDFISKNRRQQSVQYHPLLHYLNDLAPA